MERHKDFRTHWSGSGLDQVRMSSHNKQSLDTLTCPPWSSPECTETPEIKPETEDQSLKQEELLVTEHTRVCVKEENSQTANQNKDGVHTESECEVKQEEFSDFDEDWACPLGSSESSGTEDEGGLAAAGTSLYKNKRLTKRCSIDERDEHMKHQCPICKNRYKYECDLRYHSKIHTGEKPFTCSTCLKRFVRRTQLEIHKRVHTKEKLHICAICKKMFSQKGHLDTHMRTHTGEKPFSCLFCMKPFSRLSHLQAHQTVHTNEKSFSCSVCKKTFSRFSNLYKHKVTHTGEKPFLCEVCNRAFNQKATLDRHVKTHSGRIEAFTCAVCDKTFTQKGTLNRHNKIHTGVKQFSCTLCKKTFVQKVNLERHLSRMHTDTDSVNGV